MTACLVCGREAALQSVLCTSCSSEIAGPPDLLPAAIASKATPCGVWLVDEWGRPHAVPAHGLVGRAGADVAILHPGVSRKHALVERQGENVLVTDLSSHNGTFLEGERMAGPTVVPPRKAVRFGPVAFFVAAGPLPVRHGESTTRTLMADEIPSTPPPGSLHGATEFPTLLEPARGGGGVLQHQGRSMTLTMVQFALIDTLLKRVQEERRLAQPVRGFVPSTELLVSLPWSTHHPDEAHLKQLIRRMRRRLEETGVRIVAKRGFGYRLEVVDPSSPASDDEL